MKKRLTNFRIPSIVYVLALGFIVRIGISAFGTLQLDHGTFIAWSNNLVSYGFKNFYTGWSDYFPGYLYVLWFLGKINAFGIIPQILLYKLPAILTDIATGYLIYKIILSFKFTNSKALFGTMLYLFNPAIFGNSALWGQVDSLTAFFSLFSVYVFPTNIILSAISLALGILIKPQAVFIAFVILFLMLKNKISIQKILSFGVLVVGIFFSGFLPFWYKSNFFVFVWERVSTSLNQYPYLSVNAFNFWGLSGMWKPDTFYYQYGGYLIVAIGFLLLAKKLWNRKNAWVFLTSYIFLASFLFFTRMHERHMLPVFAPFLLASAIDSSLVIPYVGLSIVYILNLIYSYRWITQNFLESFPPTPVIFLGLVSFGILIWQIVNQKTLSSSIKSVVKFFNKGRKKFEITLTNDFPAKKAKLILIAIVLFAFTTRVFQIQNPKNDYFDEIYHAFTARLVLHNDPKAWEWWNKHPEGFAYECTHPPLSKLGMALGMVVFGENSFGWRFPQAIIGTIAVYLIYLIAKQLFNDEKIALLSAFIFSLDGLFLVLSRMGMNDTYVLTFSLLAIYFFMKEKDFRSAIFLGFAISSKWSAIWTIPILFLLWLKRKNKLKISTYLAFIFLPFGIYLLSYFQMFTTGHGLDIWWGMQKQMWWYHTNLRATHPYTSPWYTWPLDLRPVYLYTSEEIGGWVERIYAIGNPFVFWFGLFSVVLSAIYAFFEKNKKLAFLVFSYLIFFAPWAMSPRIMFLYHYLPSIPFMCIASGYILRRFPKTRNWALIIGLLIFIYFYPHWTGINIPLWLDKSYYWISSWR